MVKKLVAALLAGSMVLSSSAIVMAGEPETESGADSVTASTESEAQDADRVDFRGLVETMISEIEEAVTKVDLKEKAALLGDKFSEDGTVFAVAEDVLSDIVKSVKESGGEVDASVEEALEALTSIEDTDESKLDELINVVLLGLISDKLDDELEEGSKPADVDIAIAIADFVFENVKENEEIAEAVEKTGSALFDMLDNSSEELDAFLVDDQTADGAIEVPEWPFERFEEELAKVTDYINEQDGPKQAALDLLDLVHKIVDEIHYCVHGHTSEDVA